MAKFNFSEKRANLKDVVAQNGYRTEKGQPDVQGVKKTLDASLSTLKAERLERATTSFEYAFVDVLTARRLAGETLSRSSFEDVCRIVVGLIKNVFDTSELSAALVCVESGVRSLQDLRETVTGRAEYQEIIKRMKMLLTGRRIIAAAKRIGAIDRDTMKAGFDHLNAQRQTVQSVNHAQGIANLWLLKTLGYDFKGLQTAERLEKSLAYLDACATTYTQDWNVDTFAEIFGFSKVQAIADTHQDEIDLQASDDMKADEKVEPVSLVEQIGASSEVVYQEAVAEMLESARPATGKRASKAKLAA